MGKRGSWFSAIKRVFTHSSKDKLNESERKSNPREKKKTIFGRLKNGERSSFIPLFREPSSIEKILGDVEREHNLLFRPPTPPHDSTVAPSSVPQQNVAAPNSVAPQNAIAPNSVPPQNVATPNFVAPQNVAAPNFVAPQNVVAPTFVPPRVTSARVASPRAASPPRVPSPKVVSQRHKEISYSKGEPSVRNHHASATQIQAAYRGYMARRSFRALRGLVRLQGVVRSHNVKRQTMNAMKQMQLVVRVQSQIQSRRIHMLENHQSLNRESRDSMAGSVVGKWTSVQASEAGNQDEWDDSVLTKEQLDAKNQRKVEAIIKRERAMSYSYSNQAWKATPKSTQTNIQSGGFTWWWNWLERQPENQGMPKSSHLSPPMSIKEQNPSLRPQSSNYRNYPFEFDHIDTLTPKSSKSAFAPRWNKQAPKTPPSRLSQSHITKSRPVKDDDSLVSCPPFSVPNYMTPTVSAKAKSRGYNSNSSEKFQSGGNTPSNESKRRLSFPLFSRKDDNNSPRAMVGGKTQSFRSIENMSVDSTVSLPAGVGRKPFNRFV